MIPIEVAPNVGKSFSRRKSTSRSAKPHVFGGRTDSLNGCVARRFARLKPCEKSRTFVAPPVPSETIVLKRMSHGRPKMPLALMRSRSDPGTSCFGYAAALG